MSMYNEPLEWLRSSIDSILAQTFGVFEFIIINDNPARQELNDLLKGYCDKDDRIRIIENEKNMGPAEARNRGLRIAVGKYIAIMDADDVSQPKRLELQNQFLEKNTEIFLVGSSVRIMCRNGELGEKATKHSGHKEIVKAILTGKLAFYHPAIMFRNEGFLYRSKFACEDYDFYLGLLLKGKRFSNIKEVGLYYRMSDQSISMTRKRRQVIHGKVALKFYYEKLQTGYDSYDKLDFDDEEQLVKFTGIPLEKLEIQALKEQIVFALGAGDYETAHHAFNCYKKYNPQKGEELVLWLFLTFPRLRRLYRKLRYEIFKL